MPYVSGYPRGPKQEGVTHLCEGHQYCKGDPSSLSSIVREILLHYRTEVPKLTGHLRQPSLANRPGGARVPKDKTHVILYTHRRGEIYSRFASLRRWATDNASQGGGVALLQQGQQPTC